MRTSLTIALSLLALAPGEPGPPSASPASGRGYERVVERAIVAAQAKLEAGIEVWEDHSRWDEAWRVESQHYRVRTTHSYYLGARIANGLETMLGHFQSILGDHRPSRKLAIWVFPELVGYNDFGNNAGGGDEHSSFWSSFFAPTHAELPVAALYDANTVSLEMTVTHSALHQFLADAFPTQPPLWVSEGLAAYFTVYWAYYYSRAELMRLMDNERYVPLVQLLGATLPQYANLTHERFTQLGMLFYYLLHYNEETRITDEGEEPSPAPFLDYLLAHLSGGDPAGLPFHSRFNSDVSDTEREFREFEFPLR